MKKNFKGSLQLLHDSSVCRAEFSSVTGLDIFPLYFYAAKWIEDKKVADRLLELWENFLKSMNFLQSLSKSKRPSCKSYKHLKAATNDVLTIPKLSFLIFFFIIVEKIVEPFLKKYQ